MGLGRTVFIVDGNFHDRRALTTVLTTAGYSVELFESAEQFLGNIDHGRKGCLVADIPLPGMSGLDLIDELPRRGCYLPVVVAATDTGVSSVVRAMKAGAVEFFEKPVEPQGLVRAVQRCLDNVRSLIRLRSQAAAVVAKLPLLSDRERAVFEGLASGRLSKEIAGELGISPRTVEIYRANVMAKFGARNQSELIRMGVIAEVHQLGSGLGKAPWSTFGKLIRKTP